MRVTQSEAACESDSMSPVHIQLFNLNTSIEFTQTARTTELAKPWKASRVVYFIAMRERLTENGRETYRVSRRFEWAIRCFACLSMLRANFTARTRGIRNASASRTIRSCPSSSGRSIATESVDGGWLGTEEGRTRPLGGKPARVSHSDIALYHGMSRLQFGIHGRCVREQSTGPDVASGPIAGRVGSRWTGNCHPPLVPRVSGSDPNF
jgi:hypothetical protein